PHGSLARAALSRQQPLAFALADVRTQVQQIAPYGGEQQPDDPDRRVHPPSGYHQRLQYEVVTDRPGTPLQTRAQDRQHDQPGHIPRAGYGEPAAERRDDEQPQPQHDDL